MTDHIANKRGSGAASKRDRYHHGDLRRDLLRAARVAIAAGGAEELSLASLARTLGVAQSASYRHFADRKSLLAAVATEGFEELADELQVAIAATRDPGSTFDAVADAYFRFADVNVQLYRLMFATSLTPDAADGSALDLAAGRAFALLRSAVYEEGAYPDDEDRLVYREWAVLHGLVMLRSAGFIRTPLKQFLRDERRSVKVRPSRQG